jgi:alkylresorcinol/alkylpyrone synthase
MHGEQVMTNTDRSGIRQPAALVCGMFITGLGTATPPRRYLQKECWQVLQSAEPFSRLKPRSQAILRKVLLGDNGIVSRHLALDPLNEAFELTPDASHERFVKHAQALATQAARNALADADVRIEEIDAIVISTCTGYLCPGLTSYVSGQLGLRADVLTLDLVGQGCGAALPNFRASEALLAAGRCNQVLSVCVEVCSAAFYLDNDPGVLISACLFGDGAGAAVLSRLPSGDRRRVEWKAARSVLSTEDRDYLRFEQRNGMLRNILGRQVPGLAAKHAGRVLSELLAQTGVSRDRITAWIMHAGGRDVLVAIQERLGLTEEDLQWSTAVLREYGNLSSPFVYFVMQAALAGNAPGGNWWMSSFGAGFSCHGALLEVE